MSLPVLADLKNYLRVTWTTEDAALTAILGAAAALAETILDRPITAAARTYTAEDRRAASLGLSRLSYDPVPATFIRIPDAPVDITQAITITDRFGTVIDPTLYRAEAGTGIVRSGSASTIYGGGGFAGFPYTITATTGLATRADYSTVVEPAISQAIIDISADLYQRRNPAATEESDKGGSVRYGRAEEDIPTRALALLQPFRRPAL